MLIMNKSYLLTYLRDSTQATLILKSLVRTFTGYIVSLNIPMYLLLLAVEHIKRLICFRPEAIPFSKSQGPVSI